MSNSAIKKDDIVQVTMLASGYSYKGKVQWVVGEEASIEDISENKRGSFSILNVNNQEVSKIELLISATPNFQSSIAQLTDEQLRASLDALRSRRLPAVDKVRKVRSVVTEEDIEDAQASEDPIAKLLKSLPADKKEALMKKLGMV